jgi:hypothetical protein
MVVEIWPVGSAVLPSGTITFPDGVVITVGGGGGGVLVLFATVLGGVELLFAAGTPAEGFFATRGRGFLTFGGGAGAGVVAGAASAAGAVVVVSVAGGAVVGVSIVGASACGAGTAGFFFLQPEAEKMSPARAIGSITFRIPRFISSPFPLAR